MKIRFSNPCDNEMVKTRTIPTEGKSKKCNYSHGVITWEFTQWEYHYSLEIKCGEAELYVSTNPSDCFDWQKTDVELIG